MYLATATRQVLKISQGSSWTQAIELFAEQIVADLELFLVSRAAMKLMLSAPFALILA